MLERLAEVDQHEVVREVQVSYVRLWMMMMTPIIIIALSCNKDNDGN